MRCEDARELLTAFVDGELGADPSAVLAAHFDGCASCRAEAARRRRERSACREALSAGCAPVGLRRRILDASAPAVTTTLRRPVAWAAAAVLAIVVAAPTVRHHLGNGAAHLRPAAVTLVCDGGDVGSDTACAAGTLNLGDSPF